MAVASHEELCCRFCLDTNQSEDNPLIAPCRCNGTSKYVHRACLDAWRKQSLNPKAITQCTICSTPFRIQHKDGNLKHRCWKTRLALDICAYLGLRLLAFLATSIILACAGGTGFAGGCYATCGMVGLSGILYALWHLPFGAFPRAPIHNLFPKGNGKGSDAIAAIIAVIGLCILIGIILVGIYRLVCVAQENLAGAVRGANAQAREKVVKEFVVLDLKE